MPDGAARKHTNANGTGASSSTYILYSVWGYSPLSEFSEDEAIDETTSTSSDYKFNPILNQTNMLRNNKVSNLNFNAYIDYAISKEFKLRVTGALVGQTTINEVFNNSSTYLGSPLTQPGRSNGVNGSISESRIRLWSNENTLHWVKQIFEDHNLETLGGLLFAEACFVMKRI